MIRYALACDQAHEFESWFPNSAAYDDQVARKLVACPMCGSAKVEKQIMAPSVATTDKGTALPQLVAGSGPLPPASAPTVPAPQPMALLSEHERQLRAMLKAVHEHVTKNADYVGPQFAEEARKMHYGETEQRSIYGEASPVDAKALIDEGIEVHPLPIVADDRN
jgi:hypothetical protein